MKKPPSLRNINAFLTPSMRRLRGAVQPRQRRENVIVPLPSELENNEYDMGLRVAVSLRHKSIDAKIVVRLAGDAASRQTTALAAGGRA